MSFGSRSLNPPTSQEVLRWELIKGARQCCGCNISGYVEIHHLLSAGLRLGHRYTVGLCENCHANVKTREFKAMWPNQELLDHQDDRIHWAKVFIPKRPERRRKSRCTVSERQVKRPEGWRA